MSEGKLLHLGIIMDGNRRWAKANNKPTIEGHRAGFTNLKKLLKTVHTLNIEYLTVYAFSSENWQRAPEEVSGLMKLVAWVLQNEIDELHSEDIRLRIIGDRNSIPKDILQLIEKAEAKTKNNTKGTLAVCFNYGGQQELVDAANAAAKHGEITSESIEKNLYEADIPPLDLVIRTSGEQRISNFMLWRAAYAELAFTKTLWPDFSGTELETIVQDYANRGRRFGK